MTEPWEVSGETERALIDLVRHVASSEILPRFRRLEPGQTRSKTAIDDLVTVADLAAERAIAAGLGKILPGARIVGEEAVAEAPALLDHLSETGTSVVIDPIDGTWNYAHGIAVFGTMLSIVHDGQTRWGLLYDPVMDDWIVARKGGGTWYGRSDGSMRRLHLEGRASEAGVVFLPLHLFPEDKRLTVACTMLTHARSASLRCSCHEYRTLLFGGAHGIVNAGLNPWDHAAGALAVGEAGGTVRLLDGNDYLPTLYQGTLIVARSGAEFAELSAAYGPVLL